MLLQRSEEKIAKIIGTYQFRKEEPRYSRRVCGKLAIFCLWPLPLDRVTFAAPPSAMSALHSANSNIRPIPAGQKVEKQTLSVKAHRVLTCQVHQTTSAVTSLGASYV